MALQVTGNVHTQNGRILTDMVIAARISSAFIFGRNQEKKSIALLLTLVGADSTVSGKVAVTWFLPSGKPSDIRCSSATCLLIVKISTAGNSFKENERYEKLVV